MGAKTLLSRHAEAAMAHYAPQGAQGNVDSLNCSCFGADCIEKGRAESSRADQSNDPLSCRTDRYPSLRWSSFSQRSLSRWPTHGSKQDGFQLESSVSVRPCSQHGVQGSLGIYKFSLQKCVKLFGRWYGGQWETGGKVLSTNCPHLGWLYARSHVISLGNKA